MCPNKILFMNSEVWIPYFLMCHKILFLLLFSPQQLKILKVNPREQFKQKQVVWARSDL